MSLISISLTSSLVIIISKLKVQSSIIVKHVVAVGLPGPPHLLTDTFSDLLSVAPGSLGSELRVFVIH